MRFRPNARLDPSQVQDARGRGGLPGGGLAVGGGGLGVVGVVIYLLVTLLSNGSGGGPLGGLDGSTVAQQPPGQVLGAECRTGADANTREDCRIVGYVNSIQRYWMARCGEGLHAREDGLLHRLDRHRLRDATTDVGPFYCPVDKKVYIDLGFFDELRTRFGAQRRPVRAGLRACARVRPPRAGPARDPRPHRQRPPGRAERLGPVGAAGRLLRRSVGAPRGADRLPDRLTQADIARRAERCGGRRRRPHPGRTRRARSIPRRGPTARRRSGSNGSRPATAREMRTGATPGTGPSSESRIA